ncbi:T9SS type A sorting domain-containing protein [Rasiella sp. SM2506]|uniref:T9SS type A sorting domain-containing protein n=1 Tax=Rasiella sp. SM2506 TaxID=3423914 RepID=UPI003D7A4425
MSKITKNNFGKKLAKYGALSLAIAGVADATGQVVYTDVDPDFVGGMGDSFAIDFNADGTDDIQVLQSNNGNYELVQALPAAGNGVIAASNAGYLYASNLADGTAIDGSGAFGSFGSFCAGPGYTGSQFCGTGVGLIGVQFDAAGNTHYGWVRVDIADSSNFTVLGYAFESTPDTAIAAGDEGSPLGVNEQAFANFDFFVSNEQLNLSAANAMNNVTVFSILGQQVVNQKLSGTNETVNVSALSTGIYVAKVSIDGAVKTIKFAKK